MAKTGKGKRNVAKQPSSVAKTKVQETAIGPVKLESAFLMPALIDSFIQQFTSPHTVLPLDEKRKQEAADFLTTHHLTASKVKRDLLDIACKSLLFPAIAALLPDPLAPNALASIVIADLLPATRLLLVACIECYQLSPIFKVANFAKLEQHIPQIPPTALKNLLLVKVTSEQKLFQFLNSRSDCQALMPVIMSLIKTYGFEKDADIAAMLSPSLQAPISSNAESSAIIGSPSIIIDNQEKAVFLDTFDRAANKFRFLFQARDSHQTALWHLLLKSGNIDYLLYCLRQMPALGPGQQLGDEERRFVESAFQESISFALSTRNRFFVLSLVSWFQNVLGKEIDKLKFYDDDEKRDSLLFVSVFHEYLASSSLLPLTKTVKTLAQAIFQPRNDTYKLSLAKKLQFWAIFSEYQLMDEAQKVLDDIMSYDVLKLFNMAVTLNCAVTVLALLRRFDGTIFSESDALEKMVTVACYTFSQDLIEICFKRDFDRTCAELLRPNRFSLLSRRYFVNELSPSLVGKAIDFICALMIKGVVISALDLKALSPPFFWQLAHILIKQQKHALLSADVMAHHFDCLLQACSSDSMVNYAELEPYKMLFNFDPLYLELYRAAVVRNWSSIAYLQKALECDNLELAVVILNGQQVNISDKIQLIPQICVKLFMHLPENYHQKSRFFQVAFKSAHKTPLLPAVQKEIMAILKKQVIDVPITKTQQADLLKLAALMNSKELVEFFMSSPAIEDVSTDIASVNDQSRFSCHALTMICDHPNPDEELIASLVPSVHELHKITVDVVSELSPLCEWVDANKEQFGHDTMVQLSTRSYPDLDTLLYKSGEMEYDLRAMFGYVAALYYLKNRLHQSGITIATIDKVLSSMQPVITSKQNELFTVLATSRDPFLITQVLAYTIHIQKTNDEFEFPCAVNDITNFAVIAFDPANASYCPDLILVLLAVFHNGFVTIIERDYLHKLGEFSADELLAIIADATADSPILLKLPDLISTIVMAPKTELNKKFNYVRLLIDELLNKDYSFSQILALAQPGTDTYTLLITHMVLHYAKASKATLKDNVAHVLCYADGSDFKAILDYVANLGVPKEQLSKLDIWRTLPESKLLAMEQHAWFKNFGPIQVRIAKAEEQKRVEAEKKWQELEAKRIEEKTAEEKARAEKERLDKERLEAERKQQEAVKRAEAEKAKIEKERLDKERLEVERKQQIAEIKRVEAEQAKIEKQRLKQKQLEAVEKQQKADKPALQKQIMQAAPKSSSALPTLYSSVAATQQAVPKQQNVTIMDDRERLLAERQAEFDQKQAKLADQEKSLQQREIAVLNKERAADAQARKDKEQQEQIAAKDQEITALKQQVTTINAQLNGVISQCWQLQKQIADMTADKVARDHIIARYQEVVHPGSAMSSNGALPRQVLFYPPNNNASRTSSASSSISPKSPASS